jgi:hypothetical protein
MCIKLDTHDSEHTADIWFQYEGWVPYHTIAGDYLGCKSHDNFYSPLYGFVSTYEELAL